MTRLVVLLTLLSVAVSQGQNKFPSADVCLNADKYKAYTRKNLALERPCKQDATVTNGNCENALDGNLYAHFSNGKSCSNTGTRNYPWWRVELEQSFEVREVMVTNRGDCCGDELSGFEIRVGNSLEDEGNKNPRCSSRLVSLKQGQTKSFYCQPPLSGKYVNIRIPGNGKTLTLCEVQVFGVKTDRENLALNRPCSDANGECEKALDGNTFSSFYGKSCFDSGVRTAPWWRVDLFETYEISEVQITNRLGLYNYRLIGFEIRVGNSLEDDGNKNQPCGTMLSMEPGETRSFFCNPARQGKYVNIRIPGNSKQLSFCEVKVYGKKIQAVDLALNRPCAQDNSPDGNAKCEKAIDGDLYDSYAGKTCATTGVRTNPWWRVDLEQAYEVSEITITNRADEKGEKLKSFEIRVGNSLEENGNKNPKCGVLHLLKQGKTMTYKCIPPRVGKYVNIRIPGTSKELTLCEVKVKGKLPDQKQKGNLALDRPCKQEHTQGSYKCDNAVDGDRHNKFAGLSCMSTGVRTKPWIRVSLDQSYLVNEIIITNRGDNHATVLKDFEIRVGNSLQSEGNANTKCGDKYTLEVGETRTFICNPAILGKHVNILIPHTDKTNMEICEIEVYGKKPDLPAVTSPPSETRCIKTEDYTNYGKVNWALNRPCFQEHTASSAVCSRAVDGDTFPDLVKGLSCSTTGSRTNPWWRVTLDQTLEVREVRITNPEGDNGLKLEGFEIRIGDSLEDSGNRNPPCGGLHRLLPGETKSLYCQPPLLGKYVNIRIPGSSKTLSLCEVQVFGIVPKRKNLALNRPCSQTTGECKPGIDGDTYEIHEGGSCVTTGSKNLPYWRVNLDQTSVVEEIIITTPVWQKRLEDFEIRIGDSLEDNGNTNPLCGTLRTLEPGQTQSFKCKQPMRGKYVTIRIPANGQTLALCEVKVFGTEPEVL